jgi:ferrochelatase
MSDITPPTSIIHHQKTTPRVGVLLANLGTPDAPTPAALRRYLAEFLSDTRVIDNAASWRWKAILHGIILRVRPKKSAALYQSVWTANGSPLLDISLRQTHAIQAQLGEGYVVALGMRYGNPSIASALQALQQAGVRKIIVLPLYPQYAGPTTASTFDAVADELKTWHWVPELVFINNYCDDSRYIEALSQSVQEHITTHGMPERFIFSYHGMPKRYFTEGDPYYCWCVKTTRLVQERLGLEKQQCITSFQSRFGREEWLKPYTDELLAALPNDGIKHIAILSPAFSADCLETLEELAVENREHFLASGGDTYHYVSALNDRADHIHALADLIRSRNTAM